MSQLFRTTINNWHKRVDDNEFVGFIEATEEMLSAFHKLQKLNSDDFKAAFCEMVKERTTFLAFATKNVP